MPANYADERVFGVGVKFPKRPLIDNATRRKLWSLGFKKMPLNQTYLAQRNLKNIIKACDFLLDYNKEYFPDADPIELPEVYHRHSVQR